MEDFSFVSPWIFKWIPTVFDIFNNISRIKFFDKSNCFQIIYKFWKILQPSFHFFMNDLMNLDRLCLWHSKYNNYNNNNFDKSES